MAVKGLNETLASLDKAEFTIQEDIKYEIEKWTEAIASEAMALVTEGGNDFQTTKGIQHINENIDQFIVHSTTNNGYTGVIEIPDSASELAIFIEFGTGRSAAGYVPTLPPELQAKALEYFKNGKGTLIKRPFLIPAFFNNKDKVLYAIRDKLKEHGITAIVFN